MVATHCNVWLRYPSIIEKFLKRKSTYQNPYQKGSPRLFGYDYSSEGWYFITICTKNRLHHFGQIKNKSFLSSGIGEMIIEEWLKTPKIRKSLNITLDKFCLMPNHFHAIIKIGNPLLPSSDKRLPASDFKQNRFGKQSQNLSSIIRGFKGACTKRIHLELDDSFQWQSRFYDHIIRDIDSLNKIQDYICNNPINWEKDDLM